MSSKRVYGLLRLSCMLTLLGLVLCTWSLLVPKPLPVIIAMTLAQAIGTLAFVLYLGVIFVELRSAGIFGRRKKS